MSTTINCQDCDQTFEMTHDLLMEAVQAGAVRASRGHYGSLKYHGICDTCQAKHRRADRGQEEDEFVRLFRLRDEVRTAHPEWTLQQAVTEAVRLMNDPWRELNMAYRHYLISVEMERAA